MAKVSSRLGWLGALFAGFGVVGHFGGRFLLASGSVSAAFHPRDLIFVAVAITLVLGWFDDLKARMRPAAP